MKITDETLLEEKKVKGVKKAINKSRIKIKEKKATVKKLGIETVAIVPKNPSEIEVMFAGKMCVILLGSRIRANNTLKAYLRSYSNVDESVKENLKAQFKMFDVAFEAQKKVCSKIASNHPLWKRLKGILGFSPYQLALIMSYMKDIKRFETASKLCMYAGNASVNGRAVTKANIPYIKEVYQLAGKEYKGFSTELAGRMFVITDCLLRANGYFYNLYLNIRSRITKRALDSLNKPEAEHEIEKVDGNWYMKGKKKQSLKLFTDRNAKRRLQRTLLHIIWAEWRRMENLPVRVPYAVEYLGHNEKLVITLDDVLDWDENVIENRAIREKILSEQNAKLPAELKIDLLDEDKEKEVSPDMDVNDDDFQEDAPDLDISDDL